LIKVHCEELGGCESKEEKQGMLAKIFDDTLEQYKSVLRQSKKQKRSYQKRISISSQVW
jgi:hypothetical protein